MRYWLLKTEPDVFSFDDLKKRSKKTEPWNGVRNYQVRNMMRDDMKVGDLGFIYHSSCEVPGVAGVVRISSEARPDPTQFEPDSEYYDKGSKKEDPRWLLIDVTWEADFKNFVPLTALRDEPRLTDLVTLRRGNRLSVTPVEKKHFDLICKMGGVAKK
ncbi:MAG TPA: EVE domain-containing protein [Candidatus Saccharimonadia bacterium]|nr:EVE domain-containing protein [Candidatus Saccharimonadia bacterium]